VGPSGAGKTSLLYCLSGLDKPDSGQVVIAGTDIYALSEEQRSRFIRSNIGFVFQQYNLVPYLTVEENVMLPLSLSHRKPDIVQVVQLLQRFGLRAKSNTTVSALSGGEQQRTALCRALLMRPAVVFADEPTGALDTANSALVLQVLRELADAGSSVVMVTHDTDAAALADRVVFLRDGQVTGVYGRLTAEQIVEGMRRALVRNGQEGRRG
jgi:putative ABC transport system ATP-binding protein